MLRVRGSASRAQLAAGTRLSRATISEIAADLRRSGLIVRSQGGSSGRRAGRIPELLTLNPDFGVIVGVEFSHTRVTVIATDATHRIIGSKTRDHDREEPWPQRLGSAVGFIDALVPSRAPLIAIGFGVPGAIAGRAGVLAGIARQLTERYGVPVRSENNARLAGLAEFSWGAGQDMNDLIYVRLSEGVGGLLILDDEPRLGTTGAAGEFGHVCLDPNGPVCRCTNRGCLEAYVGLRTVLSRAGAESVNALRDALDRDEPRAHAVVADAGARIGLVLANACSVLDVSSVVLGGPFTQVGDHLLRIVRQSIMRHAHSGSADGLRIRLAELGSVDGALGGVALVLRDHTIPLAIPATSASKRSEEARTA
ncbi:ROK family protein [Microbacterium murale]|uniref:NBD/HSP70 family sugar kinase/biotin operon repressor n=1 Tax=Microbacterium murale TaxID=1081040 RepID=A0ABU0P852_9MICO|nr:ROK family protein [Microbacterium murale]MDQ0643517.1 putative NBD/HSP70 family sugar kinase/biotin operon repressor [Microbacterium murale]